MPDAQTIGLFVLAALALLIAPGPAIFYIVARSVDQGRAAGLVSTLGIAVGTLVHIAAAALGLSALLVSSATAFAVVKWLGAVYLILLGLRRLFERDPASNPAGPAPASLGRVFREGIWVNVLNPKTALFFFAFLPQFVNVERGSIALQIVVLGGIFVALGVLTDGAWAALAGTVGDRLRRSPGYRRAQRLFTGSVYIGLGLVTAFSGGRQK